MKIPLGDVSVGNSYFSCFVFEEFHSDDSFIQCDEQVSGFGHFGKSADNFDSSNRLHGMVLTFS